MADWIFVGACMVVMTLGIVSLLISGARSRVLFTTLNDVRLEILSAINVIRQEQKYFASEGEKRLNENTKKMESIYDALDNRHTTIFNSTLDEFASLEEKIVMVHQDILYFDQDLDDMEERVIRLEYRPVKGEPTTIDAQAIPSRVEMPLRRMKELRRRRRL